MPKLEKNVLETLKGAYDRVGKTELPEAELIEFIMETINYETQIITEREEMFQKKEIAENQINLFDYFNDGYRSGIFAQFSKENLFEFVPKDEDGNVIEGGEVIQAKPIDDDRTRFLIRLRTRTGFMGIFLGVEKLQELSRYLKTEEGFIVVLVGGITKQFKNLTTGNYDKTVIEGEDYSEFINYTLNLWQFGVLELKGKQLQIIIPDIWKD